MKKQLLSVSAVLAAGLMAATGPAFAQAKKASKPTISIGGYMNQGLRITESGDADGRDTGGIAEFGDSEIYFKGSATLDNGIKIAVRWELEGAAVSGTDGGVIDESWLTISGSFGQLRLGEDDNVGQLMTTGYVGSWATSVGMNLCFDRDELVADPAGFNKNAGNFCVRADLSHSDAPTVSYITPRFSGFQVGASYARTTSGLATDAEFDQKTATAYEEFWAIAANFDRKFDNVRIGVAGTYLEQKSPGNGGGVTGIPNTADGYLIAALVESGPFKIAAGYYELNDLRAQSPGAGVINAAVSSSGSAYDIGARYVMGANSFGVAYQHNENEGTIATVGDDEVDTLWLTHKLILGPGVDWRNTLSWSDWDGEGGGGTADNEGWGFGTLIQLSF